MCPQIVIRPPILRILHLPNYSCGSEIYKGATLDHHVGGLVEQMSKLNHESSVYWPLSLSQNLCFSSPITIYMKLQETVFVLTEHSMVFNTETMC